MKADKNIIKKVKAAALSMQRFQWEQGTLAQAFLELGDEETAFLLAMSAAYRNAPDGRIGVIGNNSSIADSAAPGEALIKGAAKWNSLMMRDAADKLYFYIKYRAPRSIDGIPYHLNILNQIWVDAYYMAPPFLAAYGDYDEALKLIRGYRKYLFDEECGLHSHQWDDDLQTFARRDFWGVGNGWAIAGVTRVIGLLPDGRIGDKKELIEFINRMIDSCVAYQREDGLFHDVLNDPSSFVDTNTAQMVAYGIYRGVQTGRLPVGYLVYADRAREAAYGKVDAHGFVQGVCGLPHFDRPYVAPEGQAFFLLMEAAAMDYYGESRCDLYP
ncbi:MAG: glycoside hydrolase family 88 protein [Clostridiales bacterium]|nr:glycoside hydrolase family 88 protein [Clostridiales bacterium]